MKYLLLYLLSLLLMPIIVSASIITTHQDKYSAHIDRSKFIVHFSSTAMKTQSMPHLRNIEGLRPIHEHWQFEEQSFMVVRLLQGADYEGAKANIESLLGVQSIQPYLKTPESAGIGILEEVFVRLKADTDLAILEKAIGNEMMVDIESHRFLQDVYVLRYQQPTCYNALDIAWSLEASGLFVYAEANYLFNPSVTTVNDPLFQFQWSLQNEGNANQWNGTKGADMNVVSAWSITTGDPDIRIAVLDSGVDTNHVDLQKNLVAGFDATGGDTKGYAAFRYAEDGHGTACAGILAAEANNEQGIAGIAYDCSLVPIRVFYYVDTITTILPFSTSDWMASAISWAWQEGDADVMSNSWGFPDYLFALLPGEPQVTEQAIAEAAAHGRSGLGVPMLFSSGNEGRRPIWPSSLPEAIAVNATSMCDERKFDGSCDAEEWAGNFGKDLLIAAPGVKITTTDATGAKGYQINNYTNTFNGTSAACPNAAGVMALILSVNPDLSSQQAQHILCKSADKVGGYAYDSTGVHGTWSEELGYGRVNAAFAVIEALTAVGLEETPNYIDGSESFKLYPNPTQNQVQVQLTLASHHQAVGMHIYDVNGRLVASPSLSPSQTNHLVAIGDLDSGVYFCRLIGVDGGFVGSGERLVVW